MERAIIIGGGMAGLGAAWKLRSKNIHFDIFEKESRPGGLCRTECEGDFLFDYTGHLLHFRNELFKKIVFSTIGDLLVEKVRNAWVYSKNVFTRYPFQSNLYGLPEDVIVDCLYEYCKQHFSIKKNGIDNYSEWIDVHFGSGIADHFMKPYNSKLYKCQLTELCAENGGRFIPSTDLKQLLRGSLSENAGNVGYNSTFFYPLSGGIESLVCGLSKNFDIHTNEKVISLNLKDHTIKTSGGQTYPYELIISTQPLPELIMSISDAVPIKKAVSNLRWVSIFNVNLGIRGNTGDRHWVYIPEEKFLNYRIGFAHNFSENMAPPGHSSLYLEMTYDSHLPFDRINAFKKCVDDLIEMKIVADRNQIVSVKILDLPYGYVLFDNNRKCILNEVNSYLRNKSVFSAGRFGSWDYFSMEDSFMDGWNVAQQVVGV
jgi:UDP-galactopyranose mutase